mmetsp:Transcript_7270/g.7426  ORF Transcript_7270/g.7426 Transcript_7270/m.7426 type:complete len:98 (+) Transcript_7270:513-806(+)
MAPFLSKKCAMKFKCTKEISCTMGGKNEALSFDTLSTREADKIQQFVQYGYHICLLERRANKQRLHNVRFGLYDSAKTFEGPESHRGKVLANKIRSV